jgi:transposase
MAYSMDLRTRVLGDSDAGMAANEVAAKFRVSLSWVNRLKQRRRETGEIAPRTQTVFKKPAFAGQEQRLRALVDAQPDQTLAELREALQSSASLSSVWRALARLGLTLKKNGPRRRTTPARRRRGAPPVARVAAPARPAAVRLSR